MLKTFCHLHDEEGIFRFYVGGTLGVDMWAAEQLLYLKEQPGYQDIELIVALPFEGHEPTFEFVIQPATNEEATINADMNFSFEITSSAY